MDPDLMARSAASWIDVGPVAMDRASPTREVGIALGPAMFLVGLLLRTTARPCGPSRTG